MRACLRAPVAKRMRWHRRICQFIDCLLRHLEIIAIEIGDESSYCFRIGMQNCRHMLASEKGHGLLRCGDERPYGSYALAASAFARAGQQASNSRGVMG